MDLEELAQRLGSLEEGYNAQQETAARGQFMDKYGSKFSGDEGIAIPILAELNRRGIDTSAADEAVQEILDGIRAEATALLDKIKMEETSVSDLMNKVQTVEDSVNSATGAAPDNPAAAEPPADAGGAPPEAGGLPPEAGGLPPEAAGAPPPEAGGAPPPEAAGAPPPEAAGAPPPEMAGVPSDARIKNVRYKVAARRKAAPKMIKPSAEVLSVFTR